MNLEDIKFVIKRKVMATDKYLLDAEELVWTTLDKARKYQSGVVFNDHQYVGTGSVFMLLPNGREISVTKEDFVKKVTE